MSSPRATYTPGSWVAASSASAWLLVDVALDDPRLQSCWSALSGQAERVLDVLLQQGLAGLPGFALVVAPGDETRVVVRHPAVVTCSRTGEDPTVVAGLEGRTWVDAALPGAFEEISISSSADGRPRLRLPLAHGITPAEVLTISRCDQPVVAPAPDDPPRTAPVITDSTDLLPPDASGPSGPGPRAEETGESERHAEDGRTPTGSGYYGRLLGATVDRDALLAELAEADDPEGGPEPAGAAPVASGLTASWPPEATADGPDDRIDAVPMQPPPDVLVPPGDHPTAGDRASTTPAPPGAPGGLIDGVPWASDVPAADSSAASPPPAMAAPRFAAAAPIPPPAPPAPANPPSVPPPSAGTEPESPQAEVRTVNRAELLKSLAAPAHPGPTVLAVRCPGSHLTPAYSAQCRVCGEAIEDQVPTEVPRPALGRLVLSTGESVLLDRDVVLGRAPESAEQDPSLRPNLVRLTDSSEVSRMHVRVTLDGWQPMLRDLGSANGTTLTLSSSSPQQLRPQEDYVLEPGSEVSLADVVSFRYEVVV